MIRKRQVTCFSCKLTFMVDEQGETEARSELATNFPGVAVTDCDPVCQDCYAEFETWARFNGLLPQ